MTLNRIQDSMFDNSTTLTTNSKTVKGAINEVNASLADITKDLNNYKSYALNVGQSNEDWGPAIQQAVNDVSALGGGKVLIPNGIKVATPVNMASGVTVEGLHFTYNPSGARIVTLTGNNNWLFYIGNGVRGAVIRNLRIATSGTGNIGIKCQGTYPNSSFEHVFEYLFFTGFNMGISIANDPSSTGEWQCDHILINHCIFAESAGNGIYLNTMNADYVKIHNCKFGTQYNMWFDKSGFVTVDTCAGSYNTASSGAFITLASGNVGNLVVINSQAENILNFLKTQGGGTYLNPITFIGNTLNQCELADNRILNSIGNQYNQNFVYDSGATDVRIYSTGDSGSNYFNPTNNVQIQVSDSNKGYRYTMTKYNTLPMTIKGVSFPTSYGDITSLKVYPSGLYRITVSIEILTTTNCELVLVYNDENGTLQSKVIQANTSLTAGLYTYTQVIVNCKADSGDLYMHLKGDTGGTANAAVLNGIIEYLG